MRWPMKNPLKTHCFVCGEPFDRIGGHTHYNEERDEVVTFSENGNYIDSDYQPL